VERAFDDVVWTPASTTALGCGSLGDPTRSRRRREPPSGARGAAAAARCGPSASRRGAGGDARGAYAAEQGRGAAFVLAAGRLAFCGGFDLDDPEILPRRPRPPGIGMDGCLRALGERRATARSRRPGGGCWPRAPTGCPRCASARAVLGREPRREAAAARAPRHGARRAALRA
jgi:hypothetical protein